MLVREFLRMRSTISHEYPRECELESSFYRDPEKIHKIEQTLAEETVTKEEFWGGWTAPAREFTATQPEVAEAPEGGAVPLCLLAIFLRKAGARSLTLRRLCRPHRSGR